MIKAILIAALISCSVAVLVIESTTVAGSGTSTIKIEAKANASNSSNTDFIATIDCPAADVADDEQFAWYCVDTTTSDYSLVDGRSNYTTFGFEAAATGADLSTDPDTLSYNTGTVTYATAGTYTASTWNAYGTAPTANGVNASQATLTWSGLTDANLETMKLPVSSRVYCKTFYAIAQTAATTASSDLATTLTAGNNIALTSSTFTVGAVVLASIAASIY